MRRPRLFIGVCVFVLVLLNSPIVINADSPIKVIDHSEISRFGEYMIFRVTVRSSMGRITKARLVIRELPDSLPIDSCTINTLSSGNQADLQCKWDTSQN